MKNEVQRKALAIYESTMRTAADVRRAKIDAAEKEYQDIKDKAHKIYIKVQ